MALSIPDLDALERELSHALNPPPDTNSVQKVVEDLACVLRRVINYLKAQQLDNPTCLPRERRNVESDSVDPRDSPERRD